MSSSGPIRSHVIHINTKAEGHWTTSNSLERLFSLFHTCFRQIREDLQNHVDST